jgi:NDP-sugar pyrophosphorylase family protein
MLQAVILAGGLGTRLRPLTLNRPKPVVPLLNVPFLHYQLALLGAHGVRDVILSVSHLPEVIRRVMAAEPVACRLRDVVETEPSAPRAGAERGDSSTAGWWC